MCLLPHFERETQLSGQRFVGNWETDQRAGAAYVESVLTAETDPDGRLRLIGKAGAGEPDRKLQLLDAFLTGFKWRNSGTPNAD